MSENSFVCCRGGEGRLEEKRSVFLAEVRPVRSEEEAAAFIEARRKAFWDARHNCYAWIVGGDRPQKKYSDDGEPAQTAGRPMLDVLEAAGLTDVCAVVTRYFGGTLLGTGGLVRAYQGALKDALQHCDIRRRVRGEILHYTVDYELYGRIQRLTETSGIFIFKSDFAENVTLDLLVPETEADAAVSRITELSAARAVLAGREPVCYAREGRDIILL